MRGRLIDLFHFGKDPYLAHQEDIWPANFKHDYDYNHPWFKECIEKVKPKLIIEVGSFLGGSAIKMAEYLKMLGLNDSAILCIDTWLGGPEFWNDPYCFDSLLYKNGRPNFYYTFLSNVMKRKHQDMIIPFSLPSIQAAKVIVNTGLQADMIYIDACHDKESVCLDYRFYWPLLKLGGILLGDDYTPGQFDGLVEAVKEFSKDNGVIFRSQDKKVLFVKV